MDTTGMSEEMLKLFKMMKMELEKQTTTIIQNVTDTLMRSLEDKIQPIIEENRNLKIEVETLNRKIKHLENVNRKNNIIIHGVKETEKSYDDLFTIIKNTLKNINVNIEKFEINKYHRLGRKQDGKTRPVLITFTSQQKRAEILKHKKQMPQQTYITEDFSKETIEVRKNLQLQLKEEKKRGNIAFIKNNKLIIKEKSEAEKRKRKSSMSPDNIQRKLSPQCNTEKITNTAPSKMHKIDAFAYMRSRSFSLSDKHTQQNKA
ncbi:unnamed protein product [Euphydryas editha]|uniref:Endonuclease-reverse transcriptase n=1 Tax=Euphydryas editha TaxID=104508 RepID=A0AAU9TWG9_EUPED|nr:unnamed protein product [Euphydryas editha]